MSFRIRPGKATCAGIVGIMLVLPNSIWRGTDAAPVPAKPRVRIVRQTDGHPVRHRVRHFERDETPTQAQGLNWTRAADR